MLARVKEVQLKSLGPRLVLFTRKKKNKASEFGSHVDLS
jgi:hypothetical protein